MMNRGLVELDLRVGARFDDELAGAVGEDSVAAVGSESACRFVGIYHWRCVSGIVKLTGRLRHCHRLSAANCAGNGVGWTRRAQSYAWWFQSQRRQFFMSERIELRKEDVKKK